MNNVLTVRAAEHAEERCLVQLNKKFPYKPPVPPAFFIQSVNLYVHIK
jgi:hypothetical protein